MSSHHSASDELAAWDPLADDGGDFLAEPEAAAYSYDDYGEEADDPVVDMPHREPPARPAPTVAPDAINIMEFSEADDYSSTEDPPSADAYVEPHVPAVPATERAARRPPRPSDSVMAGAGLGVAADVALVDRTESSTSSYDADGSSDYIPPPDHGGGAGNAVYDFHDDDFYDAVPDEADDNPLLESVADVPLDVVGGTGVFDDEAANAELYGTGGGGGSSMGTRTLRLKRRRKSADSRSVFDTYRDTWLDTVADAAGEGEVPIEKMQEAAREKFPVCCFPSAIAVCPVVFMIIFLLLPLIGAGISVLFPPEIDVGITAFRIRDHFVADREDMWDAAYIEWKDTLDAFIAMGGFGSARGVDDGDGFAPRSWSRAWESLKDGLYGGGESGAKPRFEDLHGMFPDRVDYSAVNGGGSRSLLQEIEAQQSVGLWDINLIYYLKGDQISDPDFKFADDERNILTEEHVAAIKEFEDSLLALPSFQDFCWAEYPGQLKTCYPLNSLLNYMYPSTGSGGYDPDGRGDTLLPPQQVVLQTLAAGVGYFYLGDVAKPSGEAPLFRTVVKAGIPLAGYTDRNDDRPSQEAIFADWTEVFAEFIQEFEESQAEIGVVYGGDVITQREINNIVLWDGIKAVTSLIIVFIYMWFHTESAFVATAGIMQIVLCFPYVYFIYRVVLGIEYIGIMNVLSLFIILGIAVDDIFVFTDTFERTKYLEDIFPRGETAVANEALKRRLAFAYAKAGKAMFITSATTTTAFLANMISEIPVIRSFCLFMALLVIFNYVLVMTFFPAVVATNERVCARCCPDMCGAFFRKISNSKKEEDRNKRRQSGKFDSVWGGEEAETFARPKYRFTEVVFRYYYAPQLRKEVGCACCGKYKPQCKHVLIIVGVLWALLMLVFAAQMRPSQNLPLLFSKDSHLQIWLDLQANELAGTGSCETCNGYFSETLPCDGVPGSTAVIDICGDCTTNPQTNPGACTGGTPPPPPPSCSSPGCVTCTSTDVCSSCSTGFANPTGGCRQCDVGYSGYSNCQVQSGSCSSPGCVSCIGADVCGSCSFGYRGAATGCTQCEVGWSGYPTCTQDPACSSNGCVGCVGIDVCTSCDPGYTDPGLGCVCDTGYSGYPTCTLDPVCQSSGCINCVGTDVCSSCATGYTNPGGGCLSCASGWVDEGTSCRLASCPSEGCLQANCQADDQCSSCETGYLSPGTGCDVCDTGAGFVADGNYCDNCPSPGCNGCFGQQCTSCATGYASPSTGCDQCASGYGPYGSGCPVIPSCSSPGCNGCTGIDVCTSCDPEYQTPSSGCRSCASGYAGYPNCQVAPPACSSPGCGNCIGTNVCSSCTVGYTDPSGGCRSCDSGYTGYPSCLPVTTAAPTLAPPTTTQDPDNCLVDACGVPCGNGDTCEIIEQTSGEGLNVVFGIADIDRSEVDFNNPLTDFLGDPIYDETFDMSDPEAQAHVLALCTKARNTTLTIRSEPILSCVMEEFQTWCADNAYPFPVPTIDWPLRVYEFSQANPNALDHIGLSSLSASPLPQIIWIRLRFQSLLKPGTPSSEGAEMHEEWDAFIDAHNAVGPESANKAFQTNEIWVRVFTELTAINGVIFGLALAALLTLFFVFAFTGSMVLSGLVLASLLMVVCCVFGLLYIFGYSLGGIEAISLSILLGLAVDANLHLAEAFLEAADEEEQEAFEKKYGTAMTRFDITREALTMMGISITNSAGTTILALLPVFLCDLDPFRKLGFIILMIIAFALIYSIFVFAAMVATCAPTRLQRSKVRFGLTLLALAVVYGILFLIFFIIAKAAGIKGPNGETMFS